MAPLLLPFVSVSLEMPETAMSRFILALFLVNVIVSIIAAVVFNLFPELCSDADAASGASAGSKPRDTEDTLTASEAAILARHREPDVPEALPLPAEYEHRGMVLGNIILRDEAMVAAMADMLQPLPLEGDGVLGAAHVSGGVSALSSELLSQWSGRSTGSVCTSAVSAAASSVKEALRCGGCAVLYRGASVKGNTGEDEEAALDDTEARGSDLFALAEASQARLQAAATAGAHQYFLCIPAHVQYGESEYLMAV
ncbi:hypothetical protein NESM_000213200 [Novymonas esmeraldas]|uniref:Uncharacterized protein n=1 Tax=Novymonas esmeraldas TaxID=1808958 RepID=A0AAW0F4I5_9TRYP